MRKEGFNSIGTHFEDQGLYHTFGDGSNLLNGVGHVTDHNFDDFVGVGLDEPAKNLHKSSQQVDSGSFLRPCFCH